MAAVGVGSKYHVALNGQGYLLRGRGYNKRDAKVFTPRFGTGEMGEGDLDLWKTQSRDDFSGGMFQEEYDDLTKYNVIMNGLRSTLDGRLYPTPTTATGATTGSWESTAGLWTEYNGFLYQFNRVFDTGIYRNWLYRIDSSNASTIYNSASTPALPTALMTANTPDAVIVFNNMLWVSFAGNQIFSFDGTTWTADTRYGFSLMKVFNGKIYATGASATKDRGKLWSRDGTVGTTGVVTYIGDVGDVNRPINSFEVFNHRLYIGKTDGLYAYDGVQISVVLDYSKNVDSSNFRNMAVLNGALYFTAKNILYKFDGATVTTVLDLTRITYTQMQAGNGYLWFLNTSQSSSYFTDALPAYTSTGSIVLYAFDGLAWYGYANETTQDGNAVSQLMFYNGHIFYSTDGQGSGTGHYGNMYRIPFGSNFTATTTRTLQIDDSYFDGGFPNIDKVLEEIEVDAINLIAGDTITVTYRYYNGQVWSNFATLGTITSTSTSNRLTLWKANQTCIFRKVQVRVTLARGASSNASIKDFAFKWILCPDEKYEWNLTLLAQGSSDNQLVLADNSTTETKTAAQLREAVYQARFSDTPVGFEDIDITTNTNLINAAVTSFTVGDTSTFKSSGFIKIDDEVIYYTGKTSTSFTGCTRGALGTVAAGHAAAAPISAYYRVVVTSIANESVVAPNIVDGVMDSYGNESELNIILQEA